MPDSKEELIRTVEDQMERLIRYFRKEFAHQANHYQIGEGQLRFLYFLHRTGKCTPTWISQQMGITSGGVTSMADRMVDLGLIERVRSEQDRRAVFITISSQGIALLQQIRQAIRDQISERFQTASTEQLQQINEVFTWMNAKLEHQDSESKENEENEER